MTKHIKIIGWRATGFLSQGFAILAALTAKAVGHTLQAVHGIVVKGFVKSAKWFAVTAAECHINATLLDYEPKTYDR